MILLHLVFISDELCCQRVNDYRVTLNMSGLALQRYINRSFIYGLKVCDHFQCYS